MQELAINVNRLCKIYKLFNKPIDRLKESLHPWKKKYHKEFQALSEISFEVRKGETVGIIGKNGSGKSTLLKMITGVLSPTLGELEVNGKVSALLELGAGFNMEYTGVENIFLNGTIMGFSHEEMTKKIDSILEFADIGDFIHQPVKNYSSGMFARLAFSLAINVEPDILIVDEALSVGDVFFQNKCYKKFEELQKRGVSILFVSHDISAVKKYCSKVLWISDGVQIDFGDANEVCVNYYNNEINERNELMKAKISEQIDEEIYSKNAVKVIEKEEFPRFIYDQSIGGTRDAEILSFLVKDSKGDITSIIHANETYTIHIVSQFYKDTRGALFGITFETIHGTMVYSTNNFMNNHVLEIAYKDKIYESVFTLTIPKLLRGRYLISPAIASGTQDNHVILSWYQNAVELFVENNGFNLALIELENNWNIREYDVNDIKFR
ncbi:ABC transporter ATP-binding protein [Paenibacillus terrigena]|uniref:ABC transporter ATP-binding protein n=1 Tax=Paenibacillus terrigena TaxID=369333 RepID=UPI0028D794AE|nr:ABC transporter ATP-binding protein [Paenibacillus terrigena]